ncbi:MAG: hypothetical protein DI556_13305 [Rhodovulum sulfidophilum]|uniref:Uncharacterized protein n=1 Tax=Rhodovulum sulfidophilum TaxID=35806 RepID=A0A2W5N5S6_RHOSU|nr:MAG: hypothetical protein DI556_13305 [Rhodovulum sulfidophilum]
MSESFEQASAPRSSAPRWSAVATYRTDNGPVDVTYEFKDLFELHTLIARGPDQRALCDIQVTALLGDGEGAVFLVAQDPLSGWSDPG